jgi:hypothetical protein
MSSSTSSSLSAAVNIAITTNNNAPSNVVTVDTNHHHHQVDRSGSYLDPHHQDLDHHNDDPFPESSPFATVTSASFTPKQQYIEHNDDDDKNSNHEHLFLNVVDLDDSNSPNSNTVFRPRNTDSQNIQPVILSEQHHHHHHGEPYPPSSSWYDYNARINTSNYDQYDHHDDRLHLHQDHRYGDHPPPPGVVNNNLNNHNNTPSSNYHHPPYHSHRPPPQPSSARYHPYPTSTNTRPSPRQPASTMYHPQQDPIPTPYYSPPYQVSSFSHSPHHQQQYQPHYPSPIPSSSTTMSPSVHRTSQIMKSKNSFYDSVMENIEPVPLSSTTVESSYYHHPHSSAHRHDGDDVVVASHLSRSSSVNCHYDDVNIMSPPYSSSLSSQPPRPQVVVSSTSSSPYCGVSNGGTSNASNRSKKSIPSLPAQTNYNPHHKVFVSPSHSDRINVNVDTSNAVIAPAPLSAPPHHHRSRIPHPHIDISLSTPDRSIYPNVKMNTPVRSSVDRKNQQAKAWFDRFRELCNYKERFGDCNVPQKFEENPSLGIWVNKQRMEYKLLQDGEKSSMSPDRLAYLQSIGFAWAKRKGQATWDAKFEQLKQYKAINGDCLIPTKYSEDPALGRWVSTQREQYRMMQNGDPNSKMTQEKAKMLEDVGFVWRLQF